MQNTCTEHERNASELLGAAVALSIQHNFQNPRDPIQFWGATPNAVEFNLPIAGSEVVRIDLDDAKISTELIEALLAAIQQLAG